jgi:hypothetical protein
MTAEIKLLLPKKILYLLHLIYFFFISSYATLKIFHIDNSLLGFLLPLGILIQGFVTVLVLLDAFRNEYNNKMFWLIVICVGNVLGSLAYLYCRGELMDKRDADIAEEINIPKSYFDKSFETFLISIMIASVVCYVLEMILKTYHLNYGKPLVLGSMIMTLVFLIGVKVGFLTKKKGVLKQLRENILNHEMLFPKLKISTKYGAQK